MFILGLGLALTGCAREQTPYQACRDADDGCCANEDCDDDSVCDFHYQCWPRFDGSLECTEPSGDQTCKSLCDQEGGCMWGDGECQLVEIVQGPEEPRDVWVCY